MKYYPLGAPIKQADRERWEATLEQRFGHKEDAVTYMQKVLDRQINKARGLLTFNSILVAALGSQDLPIACLEKWAAISALLSCLPLLALMRVKWPTDPTEVKDAHSDLKSHCSDSYGKSFILTVSLVLSGFATVLILIKYLCQ